MEQVQSKSNKNSWSSWEDFQKTSLIDRLPYFTREGRIFDVLFSQQFDREFLDHLYLVTNRIRSFYRNQEGKKYLANLLVHHRVMLYFIQPSTRTFLSFAGACHILGLDVNDVRSVETSSEMKGESFEDTIRTFSSFYDLIIMRYPQPGYAELASFVLNKSQRPIPVINAGSGPDQHPTQALLDIYTLRRSFEKRDNGELLDKTIMMVGDLKRGRTVRSLSYLLTNFKNIRIIFSAPHEFAMDRDIINYLLEKKVEVIETQKFEEYLPEVDAVYMTRVQNEYRMNGIPEKTLNFDKYSLHPSNINRLKKEAVILHPLPRRHEISPALDNDPRAIYWRQVRNGMWTRAALIATLLNIDHLVLESQ